MVVWGTDARVEQERQRKLDTRTVDVLRIGDMKPAVCPAAETSRLGDRLIPKDVQIYAGGCAFDDDVRALRGMRPYPGGGRRIAVMRQSSQGTRKRPF